MILIGFNIFFVDQVFSTQIVSRDACFGGTRSLRWYARYVSCGEMRTLQSSLLCFGYKLGFFGGPIAQGVLALYTCLRLMFWISSLGIILRVIILFVRTIAWRIVMTSGGLMTPNMSASFGWP